MEPISEKNTINQSTADGGVTCSLDDIVWDNFTYLSFCLREFVKCLGSF